MLTSEQVAALLGRPLTSTENTNFDTYIEIAEARLSNLLCFSLSLKPGSRVFDTRAGYRTAYVDPFTDITSVKVAGELRTDWIKKQNDFYQGDWYNVIEFDERLCGERIEVEAGWGFDEVPHDLAPLLAGLFGLQETELRHSDVKSKTVEDFKVEYREETNGYDTLIDHQLATIRKYAQCERAVRHGSLRPIYYL